MAIGESGEMLPVGVQVGTERAVGVAPSLPQQAEAASALTPEATPIRKRLRLSAGF